MTYPMISHHAITCFAMSLSIVMLERLQDPSYALTALLWMYQATTEQTCFIALFLYRLSAPVKLLRPMFRISAVQSLVFKFASIAGTVYVWAKYQRKAHGELSKAWDGLFWTCTIGLAFTQVWGAWVVWTMGDSLEKRYQQKQEQSEEEKLKEFTPVLTASASITQLPSEPTSKGSSRAASSQFGVVMSRRLATSALASREVGRFTKIPASIKRPCCRCGKPSIASVNQSFRRLFF